MALQASLLLSTGQIRSVQLLQSVLDAFLFQPCKHLANHDGGDAALAGTSFNGKNLHGLGSFVVDRTG